LIDLSLIYWACDLVQWLGIYMIGRIAVVLQGERHHLTRTCSKFSFVVLQQYLCAVPQLVVDGGMRQS
jgi:hypothetical protein